MSEFKYTENALKTKVDETTSRPLYVDMPGTPLEDELAHAESVTLYFKEKILLSTLLCVMKYIKAYFEFFL